MSSIPTHWRMTEIAVSDIPDDQQDPPIARTSNSSLAETPDLLSLMRPKFQRSIVWKEKKARSFRDSLARGYPFGVVILSDGGVQRSPDGIDYRLYKILDGQQRLYWLRRMRDGFFQSAWFLASNELELDLAQTARTIMRLVDPDAYSDPIEERIALDHLRRWGTAITSDVTLRGFINYIISDLQAPARLGSEEIENQRDEEIRLLLGALQQRFTDFINLEIPVLIVGKELDGLSADVFYQLNNGLRLSNYDVLAAQWSTISADLLAVAREKQSLSRGNQQFPLSVDFAIKLTHLANERLVDSVNDQDSQYEFEIDDADSSQVSLYEYLYALSKYISSTYYKTFGSIARASTELLFPTAALLFAGSITRLSELPRFFPKGDYAYDLDVFLQAILAAARDIDDALAPVIGWDFNKVISPDNPSQTRNVPSGFGLNQAALYLATYIALRFDVNLGQPSSIALKSGGSIKALNSFKRSLRAWYLYDSLNPFEGNDAYERLSRRVWQQNSSGTRTVNQSMLSSPDLEALGRDFWSHIEDSLLVPKTPQRKRLRAVEEVGIMRTVYWQPLNVSDCDRDHVVPVARCAHLTAAPLNHVANFMPLESSLNRIRGDRFWSDCIDAPQFNEERSRIIKDLLVSPSEVSPSVASTNESIKEFLRGRSEQMAERILDNLDLEADDLAVAKEAFRRPETK